MLLGEVPAAFHTGIHDILLIAFALACAEFLGTGGAPIVIDAEGHGRQEEDVAADIDLSRTVGWFTTKYPVALNVGGPMGGLSWAQVTAGAAGLGAVIKDAKEQLQRLARRFDLRSAALPERRRRPAGVRSGDRLQLSGAAGRRGGRGVR